MFSKISSSQAGANRSPSNRDKSLPKTRRIRKRPDFLRIQDEGSKFRTKHFLLSVSRKRKDGASVDSDSRIGITVTKKVDKRAVGRNQIKRRVREVFRVTRPRFDLHADVVIIALKGAAELDFSQISRQLTYLFYKSGLLEDKKAK